MPHFDIVKKSEVKNTYRVARVMADYDVKADHANEHFTGEIVFPDDWHIGCIVGGSGTGKTTIARELFGDYIGGGINIPLLPYWTICRRARAWTRSKKCFMRSASEASRHG